MNGHCKNLQLLVNNDDHRLRREGGRRGAASIVIPLLANLDLTPMLIMYDILEKDFWISYAYDLFPFLDLKILY